MSGIDQRALAEAADAVRQADALLVTAGAGMGVDSGLPDFRGDQGFWKAYPPFARLGLSFVELANPSWFHRDPALAWGFYGHRLEMYRRTIPHGGFDILRRWTAQAPGGGFVFTSNVDGQFQAAGFPEDRIVECHGSIHHLQCLRECGAGLFPAGKFSVSVNEQTMRAAEPFPSCPECGGLARPNILMFGDWAWDEVRSAAQQARLDGWLDAFTGELVIVECGAGLAIPTVRMCGEGWARRFGATLVRINVREPDTPFSAGAGSRPRGIQIPGGALEALRAIDAAEDSHRHPPATDNH